MAKEEGIQMDGKVVEVLPNATFRILLDGGQHKIIAYLGGKLRTNTINILLGDKVTVAMSVYDSSKGRIVYRKG